LHILLLSSGKILKTPYGGEDVFVRLLGKWLAHVRQEVTLMGTEFAGIRVSHLTYDDVKEDVITKIRKKKNKPNKFGLNYILYSLRTVIWLPQVLRILSINVKDPIDIIHAHDSGFTGVAAIIAAKLLGLPVIITLHGLRYKEIESNPYINEILKRIALKIEHKLDVFTLKRADSVTIVSSTMRNYVEKLAPNSVIASIPVAIDTKNFEFSEVKRELLRSELRIEKNCKIIGNIGRLSYEKNLFTLLNSFADALKIDSSLKLVLVGEGPLETELRRHTSTKHIDNKVIFCGFRDDISNILSGFDIFLHCSYIETISTTLLEAMACGRAIICSDIPANSKWITSNEAILINPNDREGFRDAMILLSSDEMLRGKLGSNAKITASKYDNDIILPKILDQYLTLSKKS
jgi:glycosyltransferase involved in cell wall biosynthesis